MWINWKEELLLQTWFSKWFEPRIISSSYSVNVQVRVDGSKPTNVWWQTLHESFSQYHHGQTDKTRSTDQIYNIIDWQTLFTWLRRWLPFRLSKRQSPRTVLFRTTLTRTITLYELQTLLTLDFDHHFLVLGYFYINCLFFFKCLLVGCSPFDAIL